MFGNLEGISSSLSYSRVESRYERFSSTSSLDKNPVSTLRNDEASVRSSEKTSEASPSESFDVDALVSTIWEFASSRIASAKAEGASEDQLDALWNAAEKGVRQGFGEAKEILDSLGKLDDALSLKIDSAFGQILDRIEERDLTAPVTSPSNLQESLKAQPSIDRAIQIDQYERQTFALDLTTQQGDKIQIRAVNEESSTLNDQLFGERSSTQWGTQQYSGFELVIQGDLNAEEREDLDALLAEVNDLANEFYEGDYGTAFEMATELSIDGTSLQTLNLSMKEVEQKSAAVYSEMAGQPATLPKGLQPLKDYAAKLMAAQNEWQKAFDAPKALLDAFANHPVNRGNLDTVASRLLW